MMRYGQCNRLNQHRASRRRAGEDRRKSQNDIQGLGKRIIIFIRKFAENKLQFYHILATVFIQLFVVVSGIYGSMVIGKLDHQ